jgi:hypothetical protein
MYSFIGHSNGARSWGMTYALIDNQCSICAHYLRHIRYLFQSTAHDVDDTQD